MTSAPCAMVAFRGTAVDGSIRSLVADRRVAGLTWYRSLNVESASQICDLTADLIRAAKHDLLIGIDQETGQLVGAGAETTHFVGNMAVTAAADHDVIIVGTIDADGTQAALVSALLATKKPVVAVALRTPYDLALYPAAPTYLCTYGIHPPSMDALAAALFGLASIEGRLPVSIPGLYPVGHGLGRTAVR